MGRKVKEGTSRDKANEYRRTWYANLPEERKVEMRQRQREYAKARYARRKGELKNKEKNLQCNSGVVNTGVNVGVSTYEAGCTSTCNAANLNVLSVSMIDNDDVAEGPMVVENLTNVGTAGTMDVQPMSISDGISNSAIAICGRKDDVNVQPERTKEEICRDKRNERRRKWYASLPMERKDAMRQKRRECVKMRCAQQTNELNIEGEELGGTLELGVTGNIDINSNLMSAAATVAATGVEPLIDADHGRELNEATMSLDVPCRESRSDVQIDQKKHPRRLQKPHVTMSKSGNALRSRNYRAHQKDISKRRRECADAKEYWETKRIEMDLANNTKKFDGCNWSKTCCNCGVQLMKDEADSFCCNNGKRILPKLPDLPPVLVHLYNVNGFSQLSRKVNRLFSFTALCVCGQFVKLRTPSSVAMMGRAYHQILPSSMPHQPLHWYIHDDNDRYETAKEKKVPFEWVGQVGASLEEINPFCKSLKMMSNMHMQTAVLSVNGITAANEIAAITHANNSVTVNPRGAVFWVHNDKRAVYMSILDALYEPLQYPLLFPYGTAGWEPRNNWGMSQINWYRTRLLQDSLLGRLANEYLVDMYSRVEDEKLNFIATHGYKARAVDSDVDYAENDQKEDIRIPASFLGCSAWCSIQIADALALARAKGHPSFFVTMTTNPDWPEIKAKLRPGQTAADIPLVVVRAFHSRLAYAKALLRKYFGPVVYMIHVIEFQKRGLPHAHIVFRTEPQIPLEAIDSIISAEMPASEDLRKKVERYMIHYHSERCNKDNKCCWDYPKMINPSTQIDHKGYVQYRRRTENDVKVVPYSPFLLSQLDCHMNIEISATVHIFMYLYAYIYKGSDKVQYHVDVPDAYHNEVDDYINARYLSATEAAWRIFSFHITEKEPAVKCLALHLPEKKAESYSTRNTASTLERYFLRPSDPEFAKLTYIEYYEQYRFRPSSGRSGPSSKEWYEQPGLGITRNIISKRSQGNIVCRIRLVLPHVGELFYLRQILLHSSARSWEDLLRFNDKTFDTYQDTALAMGLVEHNKEAFTVMDEAIVSLYSPAQLRFLFTLLILDGAPSIDMWKNFRPNLISDFLEDAYGDEYLAEQKALLSIENILKQHMATTTDYGLPPITIHSNIILEEQLKFANAALYTTNATNMNSSFNNDQATVYRSIREALSKDVCEQPIFIDGKAGTGKTYLLNAICFFIRGRKDIVLPCATSGLAARLYPGGRTAHSLFEIPVTENNVGIHSLVTRQSDKASLLQAAKAIVWDEFPMANKAVIESVDLLLQEICNSSLPFGGKLLIAAGDFRQIAPIVKGSGRAATIAASIKSSNTWSSFNVLKLNSPIRNAGDSNLMKLVTAIGENTVDTRVSLKHFQGTSDFETAKDFLFPIDVLKAPSLCERRAFLAPINKHVNEFNRYVLEQLPGKTKSYYSYDYVAENQEQVSSRFIGSDDFLNSYTHSTLPPHNLDLKEGAVCQLVRLLDRDKCLVKNIRVVVVSLHEKFVAIRLLGAEYGQNYDIHLISRTNFFHQPENCAFTIHRRQLPLRLAYSTTFHSCLGLTLDKVVLDLRTEVFAHGQLYTALTRIRRTEDALILHDIANPDIETRNIVFEELIS